MVYNLIITGIFLKTLSCCFRNLQCGQLCHVVEGIRSHCADAVVAQVSVNKQFRSEQHMQTPLSPKPAGIQVICCIGKVPTPEIAASGLPAPWEQRTACYPPGTWQEKGKDHKYRPSRLNYAQRFMLGVKGGS